MTPDKDHLTNSIRILDEDIEKWKAIHLKIRQSAKASAPAVQNELKIIEAKLADWRSKRDALLALMIGPLKK